jgi:FOG: GAF domain
MPRFEVSNPRSPTATADVILQLDAESWLDALKYGYEKIIKRIQTNPNALCDIKKDNSIHVTDTESGRFFRILQLPAPEVTTPQLSTPRDASLGRLTGVPSESIVDLLEEIFQITQAVYEQPSREKALYFMLDLAIQAIGTDAGSIFITRPGSDQLFPCAARGPKVNEVMRHRISVGFGPARFCTAEGMGLVLSDVVQSNPFYKMTSENIGYLIRSILWVPMKSEDVTIGVLELINKKKSETFFERDLNAARFIADQLGAYFSQHGL